MLKALRSLLSGLPLIALPAVAAETAVATGITSVGPAVFMFTIGGALFLTLIFRKAATQVAHYFVSRLGEVRIRRDEQRLDAIRQHGTGSRPARLPDVLS